MASFFRCFLCAAPIFTDAEIVIHNGFLNCKELNENFSLSGVEILEPDSTEVRLFGQFTGEIMRILVPKGDSRDELFMALQSAGAVGLDDVYQQMVQNRLQNRAQIAPPGFNALATVTM